MAAVEFTLLASGLVAPLTLVLYDVGTALFRQMEVDNAARAGAGYAAYCGCFIRPASAPSKRCRQREQQRICGRRDPGALGGLRLSGLNARFGAGQLRHARRNAKLRRTNCGAHGGGFDSTYVTVNAQATYNPIFPIAGVVPAGGFVLTSSATIRIN